MIPLTLKIKNFLSYGTDLQTINFAPYHLICLSGKNGHGKSALLDAMTWALWGNARKILNATKPDQGLLRLGQQNMMVIFDFQLNGMHYRVRREFSIVRGKPYAQLDFGTINHHEQFIPLTEKTIRNTQQMIEDTIGLSFDTFANSAFIRQGQSNEFSKKSPKERKEILSSILGLDQYDSLRSGALEKIKTLNTQIQLIRLMDEKRTEQLQKKEQVVQECNRLTEEKNISITKEQQSQQQITTVEAQLRDVDEQRKQYSLIRFEYTNRQKEIDQLRQDIKSKWHEWRSVRKIGHQLPDINQLQEQKYQILNAITTQQKEQQAHLVHKERIISLQQSIQQQEHLHAKKIADTLTQAQFNHDRLLFDEMSIKTQIDRLVQENKSHEAQKVLLNEKISTTKQEIIQLTVQQIPASTIAQFEKRKAFYQQCVTMGTMLKQEQQQLQQKTILVQEDDPSCPLCEQNLSQARRRFLKSKFSDHEQFINHRIARLVRITQKLKVLLIEQHASIQANKDIEQRIMAHTCSLEEYAKNIDHIKQAQCLLEQQMQALHMRKQTIDQHIISQKQELMRIEQECAQQLLQDAAYIKSKNELAIALEQSNTINHNAQHLEQWQKTITEIDAQLIRYQEFNKQHALQEERKKEIRQQCAQLRMLYAQQQLGQEHIKQYEEKLHQEIVLQLEKQELKKQLDSIRQHKEQILQTLGSLEAQRNNLELLSKEQEQAQKQIELLSQEAYEYQLICHIVSKDGIPALLIEDTIPELEFEANQLLSKLTNNQSQLFFECMRDLKHGGVKETLDIKIADASGIRPYEMFSGGEAFRIDFALRIALAKLLAHRAGTALQTLIIDEGFGSQDEEGLNHIMDAIYKIQDDFAKIIIVSHLPFMKEQFPVHFLVEKGAQGSKIRVIEHG